MDGTYIAVIQEILMDVSTLATVQCYNRTASILFL